MTKLSLDERAAARKAAVDAILNAPPAPLPPTWVEAAAVIEGLLRLINEFAPPTDAPFVEEDDADNFLARLQRIGQKRKRGLMSGPRWERRNENSI